MQLWAQRFYNSDSWKDTRTAYLRSVNYLCERCKENIAIAKIVHHKVYLTQKNINNPEITLAWKNLEALCQDCHNKEHRKKAKRYRLNADGSISPPIPNRGETQEYRVQGVK